MSDLISREKKLLKLNEELDKKAQLGTEGTKNSSRILSPRNAKIPTGRRASIEVEKLNFKSCSRISGLKNNSLPRPTYRKEKDLRNFPDQRIEQSIDISKIEKSTLLTRGGVSSKVTPNSNDSKSLNKKTSEKPPVKPKVTQNKASTVPRNTKDFSNLSVKFATKEQVLLELNSELDKKTKKVLDDAKENIERPINTKIFSSPKKSPNRPVTQPAINKQNTKRKITSPFFKEQSKSLTETYRNKSFKESPSSEALCLLSKQQSEDKKTNLVETNRSPRKSPTSAKKPPKQNHASMQKLNKKSVSSDGLIKYLKSKLSIVESELEDNLVMLKKKSVELHASYDKQKRLEVQRDQAISKNNALTEQLNKVEEKLSVMEQQLKSREDEYTANLRELETLRREFRIVTQANANLEKRLSRAYEDLENAKNSLESMKEAERELKEANRLEKDGQDRQIKTLKRQRSELLNAYKKQLYLIDNLRRQNICMEQARMIAFGEKELNKVLEWNKNN